MNYKKDGRSEKETVRKREDGSDSEQARSTQQQGSRIPRFVKETFGYMSLQRRRLRQKDVFGPLKICRKVCSFFGFADGREREKDGDRRTEGERRTRNLPGITGTVGIAFVFLSFLPLFFFSKSNRRKSEKERKRYANTHLFNKVVLFLHLAIHSSQRDPKLLPSRQSTSRLPRRPGT